jgi:hypothetical protein
MFIAYFPQPRAHRQFDSSPPFRLVIPHSPSADYPIIVMLPLTPSLYINPEDGIKFGKFSVDRILLKWVLSKWGGMLWVVFIWVNMVKCTLT